MRMVSSYKHSSSERFSRVLLFSAVVFFLALPASSQIQLPEGKGKDLVETRCTLCHDLDDLVNRVDFSRADWQDKVNLMVAYGAPLSKDEVPVVVD